MKCKIYLVQSMKIYTTHVKMGEREKEERKKQELRRKEEEEEEGRKKRAE